MHIEFVIKLPPHTKKNSQQILINHKTNRPFICPSSLYKQYEKDCQWFLPKLKQPIAEPINAKCVFYMPTKRKVDLTNLLESIDDIMVVGKVIEDDNSSIIVSHDGSRVYYDKNNPRTEVTIDGL